MHRRFGWAILLAIGILLGYAANPHERTNAGAVAQPAIDADPQQTEIINQLKDVKAELKTLNAMFRTGEARVVVVINPSRP
jgi:hypothetical protein